MKKGNLVLGLMLVVSMLCFTSAKSFAVANNAGESQTLDVDVPTVVSPVLVTDKTEIKPESIDFPADRSDTPRTTNTARNVIVVGDGSGTSTSYVLTNNATVAADLSYDISATAGDGTTSAVITKPAAKGVLTLNNGGSNVVLFIVDNTTRAAVPTLGTKSFSNLTGGKLTLPVTQTVTFNGIEADVDMALDLDENSLTYAGDTTHKYNFTITLSALGL